MPFDLKPVLKGELLELRPLRPEDFPELYLVASDPLIWKQHPNKDRYKEEVFREFFREALESGGAFVVTVMLSIFAHGLSAVPGINLSLRAQDRLVGRRRA